jgi:hypothetical protein
MFVVKARCLPQSGAPERDFANIRLANIRLANIRLANIRLG